MLASRGRFLLLIAALLSPGIASSQEGHGYDPCSAELPVAHPPDAPISLQKVNFFTGTDHSYVATDLTNKTGKEIQDYALILELLDSDGHYIVSLAAANTNEPKDLPSDVGLKRWLTGGDERRIAPHSAAPRTFHSPFLIFTCPASARISMIRLRFSDGSKFKYQTPSLNMPTAPVKLGFDQLADLQRWRHSIVTGILSIDTQGHAQIEHTDLGTPEFREWLENQLPNWRFSTGLNEGRVESQHLQFILVIDDSANLRTQLELMRKKQTPGIVLPIFAERSDSSADARWELSCCGGFAEVGSDLRKRSAAGH